MEQKRDISAFRQYIEGALKRADHSHSFADICQMVDDGRLQFWPGVNSAIVTELIEYPSYRVLHFFLAGGDLAELEAMYPLIEKWGRAAGCDRASLVGRKGWERTFLVREEGWIPTQVVYEKKLT